MKIVAVLFTLLAASLAAPRDVTTSNVEKVVKSDEKPVGLKEIIPDRKVIELPLRDYTSEEKAVVDSVEKTEDKVEDEEKKAEEKIEEDIEPEVAASEDKPVAVQDPLDVNNEHKDKEVTDAEEREKDLNEFSAICQASTGATVEQISAINEDPADDAPRAVKCYVKCIAEHLGVVKDQVLQKDVAVATKPSTLSMDELDMAVDACSNLKTDDPCDSSYLRYSCYFRTTGKKVRII